MPHTHDRVLVTGACGFVGSHLVAYLLRSTRARIWTLCRSPPASGDRRLSALAHDLDEPLERARLPERVDLVFHCASPPSDASPEALAAANVRGTRQLLDYAERAGAQRFVYVSSGGVSGYDRKPIPESAPPDPGTPYLAAKLAGERLVTAHRGRLPTTVIRLFFPYGPGQRRGLLPMLCERLRRGEPIVVGPSGAPRLNPIHVRDAVRLIHTAAVASATAPVLNVAGDEITSVRRLTSALARALALQPRYRRDRERTLSLVGETTLLHRRYGRGTIPLASGLAEIAGPASAN